MRVPAALLILLLLPLSGAAQDRYRQAVEIGAVDSLWSATLEEQRPYLVYTPPSYGDTVNTPQHYPVLYLLDGDAHFHSVSGLIQILGTGVNGTFAVPEMIVVAIPNTDRTRDMTPTRPALGFDGQPLPESNTSGGMGAFLQFIDEELIPHIDSEYRTIPYRVFVGHSLGGITAINALYTMPETFSAYVAIDPSLWWDDNVLLKQAKDHFGSARHEGRALYVAKANTLSPDDSVVNGHFSAITQFDAVVGTYDQSGIRYAYRYYEDDNHGSVPLIAEYDALRFIFDGYNVPLQRVLEEPGLLLEHFAGISERLGETFQPSERMLGVMGRISMGSDTTAALSFGEMRAELYPESYRAHVFLGDVWAAKGDTRKARAHYEAGLARSPGNEAIQTKLDELEGDGGA